MERWQQNLSLAWAYVDIAIRISNLTNGERRDLDRMTLDLMVAQARTRARRA